ncbi:hypothetical protein B4U79_02599, partial [Dinothrombium tinctorium]
RKSAKDSFVAFGIDKSNIFDTKRYDKYEVIGGKDVAVPFTFLECFLLKVSVIYLNWNAMSFKISQWMIPLHAFQ